MRGKLTMTFWNPAFGYVLISATSIALAGCGPQTPEQQQARSIERCERQFGRMAPDPSKGEALCTCMVTELAEAGLEVTDALGGNRTRVEEITRSCAQRVGVPLQ